jgi:osmoprotectant transport system ATP-binding protein
MIGFHGVTKMYGELAAVDGLDLEIPDHELVVLVGPSGGGKSTILRMINRLIEPTRGRITLGGKNVREMRPEELRRGIGYVIQSVGLFPHMSVRANIAVVPELLGWDRGRVLARVDEMLSLVGLPPGRYGSRYPAELSGGEAQRVGVARALASDPPVILMDEPFSAVDPVTRLRLQNEFLSIQRELKKTVVFVTHDVDEAIRLADRIAVVRSGRLVQYGRPEEILESPADRFVAGFVGTDRALKRLSRLTVADFMRPAAGIRDSEVEALPLSRRSGFLWVTDDGGRLLGSVDARAASRGGNPRAFVSTDSIRDSAVRPESSLKEALSLMIGSAARTLPVVDRDFVLMGEISLADVEGASERYSVPGPAEGTR